MVMLCLTPYIFLLLPYSSQIKTGYLKLHVYSFDTDMHTHTHAHMINVIDMELSLEKLKVYTS